MQIIKFHPTHLINSVIHWHSCKILHTSNFQRIPFSKPHIINHSVRTTDLSHHMTKPTKWPVVHPAKTHISLGISPVWSMSLLSEKHWVTGYPKSAQTMITVLLPCYVITYASQGISFDLSPRFIGLLHNRLWLPIDRNIWAPSSEFVSLSIPLWQILTAYAQPIRGVRDLAFCLKVPLDSLLVRASSGGSGETARMRRLAWTFAARIGDKYQIHLTRSICLKQI